MRGKKSTLTNEQASRGTESEGCGKGPSSLEQRSRRFSYRTLTNLRRFGKHEKLVISGQIDFVSLLGCIVRSATTPIVIGAIAPLCDPLPIVKTKKWGVFDTWLEKPVLGLGGSVGSNRLHKEFDFLKRCAAFPRCK